MISIITPTHDDKYLDDLYQSLLEQEYENWEWVLVPNGKLVEHELPFDDPRVKCFPLELDIGRVGALKYWACKHAQGDIYLEVDHDDMLLPGALQKVRDAFDLHPDVCFVYSNSINTDTRDDPWSPVIWSEEYGWRHRILEFKGQEVWESRSSGPHPQSISRIWFAPNHLRAWRAEDYWEMGGHDQSMKISDDHDLVLRSYLHGRVYHIDEGLYFYRVHGENTWLQHLQEIDDTMWANHDRYIEPMMMKWSDERGLRKIDLCGAIGKPPGYESIDINPGADITADLEETWPLEDNSVGLLRANDALEHLRDPQHTMMEAYRVLAHGGVFLIAVPSTDGRGAFQDPSHTSWWNENSFLYYTVAGMNRFINCPVRFQRIKVLTGYMDEWGWQNNVPYVFAHLVAIKEEEPRYYGPLEI